MKATLFSSSLKTLRGEWNVKRHWSLSQDLKKKSSHWNNQVTTDAARHRDHEQSRHAQEVSNDSGNELSLPQHLQLLVRNWTWEADTPKLRWQSIYCKSSITQWIVSENDTTEINSLTAPDKIENSPSYPIFICYLYWNNVWTNQVAGLPPVPSRHSSYS